MKQTSQKFKIFQEQNELLVVNVVVMLTFWYSFSVSDNFMLAFMSHGQGACFFLVSLSLSLICACFCMGYANARISLWFHKLFLTFLTIRWKTRNVGFCWSEESKIMLSKLGCLQCWLYELGSNPQTQSPNFIAIAATALKFNF